MFDLTFHFIIIKLNRKKLTKEKGIDPTIGFAKNVLNKYFDVYYYKSIAVSETLKKMNITTKGGQEVRMIYTTHPFLVSFYLNCSEWDGVHCPTEEEKKIFKEAVAVGDIRWHAFPFNTQPELFDPSSFDFSILLSHHLVLFPPLLF